MMTRHIVQIFLLALINLTSATSSITSLPNKHKHYTNLPRIHAQNKSAEPIIVYHQNISAAQEIAERVMNVNKRTQQARSLLCMKTRLSWNIPEYVMLQKREI